MKTSGRSPHHTGFPEMVSANNLVLDSLGGVNPLTQEPGTMPGEFGDHSSEVTQCQSTRRKDVSRPENELTIYAAESSKLIDPKSARSTHMETVETDFVELTDGTLAELIEDPADARQNYSLYGKTGRCVIWTDCKWIAECLYLFRG